MCNNTHSLTLSNEKTVRPLPISCQKREGVRRPSMASDKKYGNVSQPFNASPPIFSGKREADGLGGPLRDTTALGLHRGSSSESVLSDGLLHRRRSNTRPRLPSFKGLGISSFDPWPVEGSHAEGAPYTHIESKAGEHHSCQRPAVASSAKSTRRTGSTPLLTPPEDLDSLKWTISAVDHQCPVKNGPSKDIVLPTVLPTMKVEGATLSEDGAASEHISLATSGPDGGDSRQETANTTTAQSSVEGNGPSPWLDQAVGEAGEFHLILIRPYEDVD